MSQELEPGTLNVAHLEPAEVLRRLYNASYPRGLGRLHFTPDDMTLDQAKALIEERETYVAKLAPEPERRAKLLRNALYFDYLKGRVIKAYISDRQLDVALYDRDNGQGAAARALGIEAGQ